MNLERMILAAPALRLETERLVLRRLTVDDLPTAIAHEQDRRIMRWIRDPQPVDEIRTRCEQTLATWHGDDGRWLLLAVQRRGDPAMLGIVCCRVTAAEHETFEIGYRLHADVHRRGYGLEACRVLVDWLFGPIGARKLVAYCVAENEPSWRLMEKLGMQREAVLREYSLLDGAWRDEFVYGLLRREWPGSG
ncbi:MAG: GNAT family N-acetyltransferase [Planctomycetes bacterium]|nr:GNAT family N-acetyltransferase [Planctomycetota bacterium]